MNVISRIKKSLDDLISYFVQRRSCLRCDLLQDELNRQRWQLEMTSAQLNQTNAERINLQNQLLELLNPKSSVRAEMQPIGNHNWKSFKATKRQKYLDAKREASN